MLSTAEKRFIRDWEFQKEGPKWKYYLQYSIAWTVVIFLSLFFITKFLMSNRNIGGWLSFISFSIVSVVLSFLMTHWVYQKNEKKLNALIKRENLK